MNESQITSKVNKRMVHRTESTRESLTLNRLNARTRDSRDVLSLARGARLARLRLTEAAKLLGGLLFPDVPLNDKNATYCSASSCIVELTNGPFNRRLAVKGRNLNTRLLDREQEVSATEEKLEKRASDLKGKEFSAKAFSPAILVAQAPGAGKSHFLAAIGEEIPTLYDQHGRNQTPIVSALTFNSGMADEIENLKADLTLRLLYGAARHMSRTTCARSDFLEK